MRRAPAAAGTVAAVTLARSDVLLAAGAAGVIEVEMALRGGPPAVSVALGFASLALAGVRRTPLAAVLVLALAVVIDAAAGGVLTAELASTLAVVTLACFLLGRFARSAGVVAAGAAAATAAMTAANQLDPDLAYTPLDDLVFFALLVGTPAVLGHLLRRRADTISALAAHTDALRAMRDEEAAAAAAEERARLALALHDAVAQRVGDMSIQAAGAERVAGESPARARAALERIEAGARAALDDIRSLIGVLRRGDDDLGLAPHRAPQAAPLGLAPQPDAHTARREGPVGDASPAAPGLLARRRYELLAAAVGAAIGVETLTSSQMEGPAVANLVGVVAVAAPLACLRRAPLTAAAATFAAEALHSALLTPLTLLVTPIALLLLVPYAVAAYLPLRAALAGLGVGLLVSVVVEPAVPTAVLALVAWGAGRAMRDREARAAELRTLADELEHAQDVSRARARGEERLRVARELHDAVAHSMTVIVLQAGAAQRVWSADRAAASEAIATIGSVARETLTQLRVTLRGIGDEKPYAGLDALERLAERFGQLGVAVDVVRAGRAGTLPPALDHVAYSVVQEALTNAARHAAPTSVAVRVEGFPDGLHIDVVDCGRSGAARADIAGTGTGLRGMAERLAGCGGELRYGPSGSGFAVHARIPLAAVAA